MRILKESWAFTEWLERLHLAKLQLWMASIGTVEVDSVLPG